MINIIGPWQSILPTFLLHFFFNFIQTSLPAIPVWPTLTTVPVSGKLHPWATFTHKAPFCVHTKPLTGSTQALINICRKNIVDQQIWRQEKRSAAPKDKNGGLNDHSWHLLGNMTTMHLKIFPPFLPRYMVRFSRISGKPIMPSYGTEPTT